MESMIEQNAWREDERSSLRELAFQLFGNLNDARARLRLYAVVAAMLFMVAMMFGVVKWRFSHKEPKLDFAASDGKFYYLYISSAIVDGDLDFTNQLREQWPAEVYERTPQGYILDKYPIGVSLSLLPSFLPAHVLSWMAHGVTGSPHFAPNGYTGIYQFFNLAWVFFLSWATFSLLDRLMSHHFGASGEASGGTNGGLSGSFIAAGVLSAWLGTQYLYHAVRFPMMANVISTFWVTACIVLSAEAVKAIRVRRYAGWHWPAMAFCASMAVICRPTNVVVAVFGFYALYVLLRQGLLPRLLRWIPLIAVALIPIVLQMHVWHVMFGQYITYSYGAKEPFYWTDPLLWQSLFSERAGLFLWCPVWTLGTVGAVAYLFRKIPGNWLLGCYVTAFVLLWYLNSAWWCWPFSCYPGRGYLELIDLPAIGIALLFQHTASNVPQRRLLVALLLLGIACTSMLEVAYDLSLVPRYADDVMLMGPAAARRAR